ncbi:MAG: hypothetical protein WKG00_03215 [Polyangiaceae bacterium]
MSKPIDPPRAGRSPDLPTDRWALKRKRDGWWYFSQPGERLGYRPTKEGRRVYDYRPEDVHPSCVLVRIRRVPSRRLAAAEAVVEAARIHGDRFGWPCTDVYDAIAAYDAIAGHFDLCGECGPTDIGSCPNAPAPPAGEGGADRETSLAPLEELAAAAGNRRAARRAAVDAEQDSETPLRAAVRALVDALRDGSREPDHVPELDPFCAKSRDCATPCPGHCKLCGYLLTDHAPWAAPLAAVRAALGGGK